MPADAAVMESAEARKDLPCSLKPLSPELGFDLSFHTGYEVSIPIRELARVGSLTAVFRVTAGSDPGTATYFSQKWSVPPIEDGATGTVHLRGAFILGEGEYLVEWLMRDRAERYCATRWQISVEKRGKDRPIELSLAPATVRPEVGDLFANEPTVKFDEDRMLNVVVLFHVAPQVPGASGLQANETAASLAILRNIARDRHIGTYSVAAFNLEQNKLLYRGDATSVVDFRAMGGRINELRLGTVTVEQLREKDGRAEFLANLVSEELSTNRPDALILVGPRRRDDSLPGSRAFSELGSPLCPVFYLSYDAHANTGFRDLIGSAVKVWKGKEFTITAPRDVPLAWAEVISQLSRTTSVKREGLQRPGATNLLPSR